MKKAVSILLVLVITLSLCACGETSKPTESLSARAVSATESRISIYIRLMYETRGVPQFNSYVKEISDGVYEVTGKVTIRDEYGDTYTGKFDATATYDESSDSFAVDYDLDKLYKD